MRPWQVKEAIFRRLHMVLCHLHKRKTIFKSIGKEGRSVFDRAKVKGEWEVKAPWLGVCIDWNQIKHIR